MRLCLLILHVLFRACVFLDWLCRVFKEPILTEPCLYTDLNPDGDLTHTLDPVHISLTICSQLLTKLLTSIRPALILLFRKILGSVTVTEGIALPVILGPQLSISWGAGHYFYSLTICHKRICKSEGCTVKTDPNQCLLEHLVIIKLLFFLLSCCCL